MRNSPSRFPSVRQMIAESALCEEWKPDFDIRSMFDEYSSITISLVKVKEDENGNETWSGKPAEYAFANACVRDITNWVREKYGFEEVEYDEIQNLGCGIDATNRGFRVVRFKIVDLRK